MATLDAIADHTNAIIPDVALLQDPAKRAEARAAEAAATAEAALAELQAQQAEVKGRIEQYESDFARLAAEEQAAVTTAIAGPTLAAPNAAELPVVPGGATATAIETAFAQVGDPYVWGGRPGWVRLLRPDLLCVCGCGGVSAARQPVAGDHGPGGLAGGTAAR